MTDELNIDMGTPVCLRCLTPYEPLQHYCEKCGTAVGQLTPYIPFVSIPFSVSLFERLWQRIWDSDSVHISKKVFYWALIVWWAPIMLLGIPCMLWDRRPPSEKPAAA